MSYPNTLRGSDPSDGFVTFSIPNSRIIKKIFHDSEEDDDLRRKVSGNLLIIRVAELAHIFQNYDIEASPIQGSHEHRVRLYVPVPAPEASPVPPSPPDIRYIVHEPSWITPHKSEGQIHHKSYVGHRPVQVSEKPRKPASLVIRPSQTSMFNVKRKRWSDIGLWAEKYTIKRLIRD
jgi:hypothetical protein